MSRTFAMTTCRGATIARVGVPKEPDVAVSKLSMRDVSSFSCANSIGNTDMAMVRPEGYLMGG